MTKLTVDKEAIDQAIEAHNWVLDYLSTKATHTEVLASIAGLRAALALAQPESNGKLFHAKFNVGDHVWYMKDNKPTEVVVSAIEVFFVNTNQDKITYAAKNVTNSISWLDHPNLQESRLFRSKAELLESL